MDVPALALQLVLRAHPEWHEEPVVVVEDDRPQARIVWANRAAREVKIRQGTTFAGAKALSAKLRAEVVAEDALTAAVDGLFDHLIAFSPHVEPVLEQPGLFWLDPSGLCGLFGNLENWARQLHARLSVQRYVATVVVGFRRGFSYAVARGRTGVHVLSCPAHERRLAERVPLSRLSMPPRLRDDLNLLGADTVGEFLALPVSQLRRRYGLEAAQLHDFLGGRSWTPLLPRVPMTPLRLELQVEPPDDDLPRLLFGFKSALHSAVTHLTSQCEAISALEISLEYERGGEHAERIETAAPTLDVLQILELVRLRLGGVTLSSKVAQIITVVEHARVHPKQVELYKSGHKRDLEAAARALSRLRASFGPASVTRARLRQAHLPEASYAFEPVTEVCVPEPGPAESGGEQPLVRRLFRTPMALPPLPSHEPEAWLGRHGAVEAMHGPHRIAGGWWSRLRERDYYYVQTQKGEILWVYYDRSARRWYLQGVVD